MKVHHLKTKLLFIIALLCFAQLPQAFAETSFEREGRWYVGVGITVPNLTLNETNLSSMYSGNATSTFDHSGNAFKLFGGYQIDPMLGIEVGITSFGEIVMDTDQTKSNLFMPETLYVVATATQPISKNIDVIGKLGMSFWSLYDNNDNTIESGQGLVYGVGLDINLYGSKKRSLLIEWEHYNFSGVALKEANTIGANIIFRF